MRALRSALPITHLTPHCTLTRHLADYNSFLSPAAPPSASCCFPFGVFSPSPAAPSSLSCCFPLSESLFSVLPLPLLRRAASLSLSHAAAWVGDPIFITSTSEHDVCARGRMPRLREVSRLRLRDAARLEGEGGQASHPAIGHRRSGHSGSSGPLLRASSPGCGARHSTTAPRPFRSSKSLRHLLRISGMAERAGWGRSRFRPLARRLPRTSTGRSAFGPRNVLGLRSTSPLASCRTTAPPANRSGLPFPAPHTGRSYRRTWTRFGCWWSLTTLEPTAGERR